MAPLAARLQAAKAVANHPRLVVSALEAELGTRYTVDLLKTLAARYGRTQFVWLMGADNMRQMAHWHQWQRLFAIVPVAVFRRPDYAAGRKCGKAAERYDGNWLPASCGKNLAGTKTPAWLVMDNPLLPFSATEIRKDRTKWPK